MRAFATQSIFLQLVLVLSVLLSYECNANDDPLYEFKSCVVQKGKQEATALGMPTANIMPPDLSLAPGTYAGFAQIDGVETPYKALFYVPSEAEDRPGLLEVHFFSLPESTDLYDQEIAGTVLHLVSEPVAWTSFDAMKEKIADDKEKCLKTLEAVSTGTKRKTH